MNYPTFNFSSQTTAAAPFSFELPDAGRSPLPSGLFERAVLISNQPSTVVRKISKEKSVGERLFDATAEAKRWTSQIAMRLDPKAKQRFFRQLDRLHDENEWFEGDQPVALDSYKAFVRAYVSGIIGGRPAFALAKDGRLIAIWQHGGDKLTMEFFPRDKVRYLITQILDGERERFAGDTSIGRLSQVLSPFGSARWFNGG